MEEEESTSGIKDDHGGPGSQLASRNLTVPGGWMDSTGLAQGDKNGFFHERWLGEESMAGVP